ncbi:MAG: hypothetical protein FWH04_09825, partial [Oscillospiraceae bacterium]|nr:hypothetical protein [Oscillospiraceae bacterium]
MKIRLTSCLLVFSILMVLAPFTYAGVYSDDISEYNIESKYFILDESLHEHALDRITPVIFNKFMERMDLQYEAMLDLIGKAPHGGSKITIINGMGAGGAGWVYANRSHIYVGGTTGNFLHGVQINGAGLWAFDPMSHELGHVFTSTYPTRFNSLYKYPWDQPDGEGWADMLAFIASYVNITVKGYGGIYMQGAIQTPAHWASTSNSASTGQVRRFVNALFTPDRDSTTSVWTGESFDFGYKLLQKVFRSYENGYTPQYTYSGGTVENRYLLDFVD